MVIWWLNKLYVDFSVGPVVKNLPANAGDTGSIHGLGRIHSPGINWACVPQLLRLCTLAPGHGNMRCHLIEKPAHSK